MTPASIVFAIALVASAPAPAPFSETWPPPTPTPTEAATAVSKIEPSDEASSLRMPPVDSTVERPSITARVVLVIALLASLTATVSARRREH